MATNRYYSGPVTDHFDGSRFLNPGQASTDRSLVEVLRWRFGEKHWSWPAAVAARPVRPAAWVDGLSVTFIGHASLLIQAGGVNLLIDPVWSERASPLQWIGPRRVNPPGIAFDDLPPIDAVLLTHNHYDHLDVPTLRRLAARHQPRMIAPLGNDRVVQREASSIMVETIDWDQAVAVGTNIVRLLPANHWSARGIGDRRMALWGGYHVSAPGGRVYVAGDTAYGDGRIFKEIAARYGSPDVAFLPIGAYAPRWFMKDQHIDPAEAVQIMLDCGARKALGIHWGTFPLTDEPRLEPKERLQQEIRRRSLPKDCFLAIEPGDQWSQDCGLTRSLESDKNDCAATTRLPTSARQIASMRGAEREHAFLGGCRITLRLRRGCLSDLDI